MKPGFCFGNRDSCTHSETRFPKQKPGFVDPLDTMRTLALAFVLLAPGLCRAADPFDKVCDEVNTKMVKVFGAGGFSRLNNFGTGILISKEGHILTVASQLLDTSDLIVHLYDGRRLKAEVVVVEQELDAAILRIKLDGKKPEEPTGLDLPFFDFAEAAKRPSADRKSTRLNSSHRH